MKIRKAEKTDIPVMAGFLDRLFQVEEDFTPDAALQERGLAMLLDSNAIVLCAEEGCRVVGMMTMQLIISTAMGGLSGLIEDVFVDPGLRGSGVGRALMNEMEKKAKETGCRRMQLLADEDNPGGHAFYRRLGWKKTNLAGWTYLPGSSEE